MHSPAPWKAKGLHIVDANGEWVAAGEWQGFMVPFVGENANDNVALAAAAPDLLKALETMLGQREGRINIDDRSVWVAANDEARAAIAKARNQPPPFKPSSIANRKTA